MNLDSETRQHILAKVDKIADKTRVILQKGVTLTLPPVAAMNAYFYAHDYVASLPSGSLSVDFTPVVLPGVAAFVLGGISSIKDKIDNKKISLRTVALIGLGAASTFGLIQGADILRDITPETMGAFGFALGAASMFVQELGSKEEGVGIGKKAFRSVVIGALGTLVGLAAQPAVADIGFVLSQHPLEVDMQNGLSILTGASAAIGAGTAGWGVTKAMNAIMK